MNCCQQHWDLRCAFLAFWFQQSAVCIGYIAGLMNKYASTCSFYRIKSKLLIEGPFVHTLRFVWYDSFVLLCWDQRDYLRISESERSFVQLIASCEEALRYIWNSLYVKSFGIFEILVFLGFYFMAKVLCAFYVLHLIPESNERVILPHTAFRIQND